MKKAIINAIFVIGTSLLIMSMHPVNATYCTSQTISNGSCEFQFSSDGFDDGGTSNGAALTVSGGTLLIGATVPNQQLAVGRLILSGGAVTIYSGAKLNLGAKVWMIDQDGDGYPDSTTKYIQATQPLYGARTASLRSTTSIDCDALNSFVHPTDERTTYQVNIISDSSAKNGTYDYNCDNGITKQYPATGTYGCDPTGCSAHYFTGASGWASGSSLGCGAVDSYYSISYGGYCDANNYDACPYSTSTVQQGCY